MSGDVEFWVIISGGGGGGYTGFIVVVSGGGDIVGGGVVVMKYKSAALSIDFKAIFQFFLKLFLHPTYVRKLGINEIGNKYYQFHL